MGKTFIILEYSSCIILLLFPTMSFIVFSYEMSIEVNLLILSFSITLSYLEQGYKRFKLSLNYLFIFLI